MRVLALVAIGTAMAGCATTPVAPVAEVRKGPDVDVEVLAMQSRPLRVIKAPLPPVKAKEEKPKPRHRRKKPKPVAKKAVELPPDETFTPNRPSVVDEPPIDIPAEGDWPAALSKEFKRREEEKKRRGDGEEE